MNAVANTLFVLIDMDCKGNGTDLVASRSYYYY